VVSQGRHEHLVGRLCTEAMRLQAHPPSLIARGERLAREMLEEFERIERAAEGQLLLLHPALADDP
jgi:hypothetical protein